MAKYNIKKIKALARKEGIRMTSFSHEAHEADDDGSQRVYDFDLRGCYLRRVKFVSFKSGRKLFPNTANVYVGSSKYGIEFDSYRDLISQIKNFEGNLKRDYK